MLTEAEAKTKWCPFARIAVGRGALTAGATNAELSFTPGMPTAVNRFAAADSPDYSLPNAAACIASACMAWRPASETRHRQIGEPPPGPGWSQTEWNWEMHGGYCGLAGRPE